MEAITSGEEEMLDSLAPLHRDMMQKVALFFIDTSFERLQTRHTIQELEIMSPPMPILVLRGSVQVGKSRHLFGIDATSEASRAFHTYMQQVDQAVRLAVDVHGVVSMEQRPRFPTLHDVDFGPKMLRLSFARDMDECDGKRRRQIQFPDRENPKHEVAWHQQQRLQRVRDNEKQQRKNNQQLKRRQQQQPRQSKQQYEKKNQRPDINYNVHKPKARKCLKK